MDDPAATLARLYRLIWLTPRLRRWRGQESVDPKPSAWSRIGLKAKDFTAFAWAVRIEPTADEIETIFQSRRSEPETKIYSLPATHSQPAAKIFRCGECYDIKTVPI